MSTRIVTITVAVLWVATLVWAGALYLKGYRVGLKEAAPVVAAAEGKALTSELGASHQQSIRMAAADRAALVAAIQAATAEYEGPQDAPTATLSDADADDYLAAVCRVRVQGGAACNAH